tara:strand:+ start:3722 stop:3970 length:249 start_codon:yes stop_codon:yes gene_type:complete
MKELLPCPFCGSSDVGGAGGIVSCYQCGITTEPDITTKAACDTWNKRAEFSTVEGKQLISEKAVGYLFDNHPEVYSEFYKRL